MPVSILHKSIAGRYRPAIDLCKMLAGKEPDNGLVTKNEITKRLFIENKMNERSGTAKE